MEQAKSSETPLIEHSDNPPPANPTVNQPVPGAASMSSGPIPANPLARQSQVYRRQQQRQRAIIKLIFLLIILFALIVGITMIVIGAMMNTLKREQLVILMMKQQPQRDNYNSTVVERLPYYYDEDNPGEDHSMNAFDYVVVPKLPEIDPSTTANNLTTKHHPEMAEKVS
jgi:hypothetical protein